MDTKDRIDANRKRLLVTASILLLIAVISITVMFVSRKYKKRMCKHSYKPCSVENDHLS